jgi:hypothetical protein
MLRHRQRLQNSFEREIHADFELKMFFINQLGLSKGG